MGRMVEDTAVIRAIRTALRADTDGMADLLCKGIETVVFKYVPTIDVVPVRHGHWTDDTGIEGAWNYCSVCGEQAIDLYNYCPNCGAKMDEEDGDHHEG